MSKDCSKVSAALVDLAEGRSNLAASEHVKGCTSCQAKLSELEKTLKTFAIPRFAAPNELIAAAKALMSPRVSRMALLTSSFSLAGARRSAQDLQAVFAFEGIELRVMYAKAARGWSVMARLPDDSWLVDHNGKPVPVDAEGRFQFEAPSLKATSFVIFNSSARLEVPNVTEAVSVTQLDT